jgi:hypothetical protein
MMAPNKKGTPDNVLSRIEALEAKIRHLEARNQNLLRLADLTPDAGELRAGAFLALSAGDEPTDATAIGSFVSADGYSFGGVIYHIGGVNLGEIQAGINSTTGEFMAGQGAMKAGAQGLSLYYVARDIMHPELDTSSLKFFDGAGAYVGSMSASLSHLSGLIIDAAQLSIQGDLSASGAIGASGGILSGLGGLIGTTPANMSDDTAISFTPNSAIGMIIVNMRSAATGGCIWASYRTDASARMELLYGGANVEATTGALSGTTGTDGKLTISANTDGKIYIENRRGATRSIHYILLGA